MTIANHQNIEFITSENKEPWLTFKCSFCESKVTGIVVARFINEEGLSRQSTIANYIKWILCPNCKRGSVYNSEIGISPGSAFGPNIEGLPKDIENAYNEARNCMQVSAFTAAELICRKIIMHIAVEKGDKQGKSFQSYLDYLQNKGYIATTMKDWVDLIRQHGNKSTHKLDSPDQERAESTVIFTAQLLKSIYEMSQLAQKYTPSF